VFGSLGFPEIAFILILALLLFGPRRLPEIGRTVGKSLAEFRRASNELRRTLENEVALEEPPKRPATPSVRPASSPPVPRGAAELAASKESPAPADDLPSADEVPERTAGSDAPDPDAADREAPADPETGRPESSRAD